MKRQLTFKDRAALMYQILPKFGNIETMKTTRQLKKKIDFSADEKKLAGLQEVNNRLAWNEKYVEIKDMEVSLNDAEEKVIKAGIEHLDRMGQIQEVLLDTIDRFV